MYVYIYRFVSFRRCASPRSFSNALLKASQSTEGFWTQGPLWAMLAAHVITHMQTDQQLQSCHRHNLECPKSQATHPPGSQQMRPKLLEPAGHPWADLGLQSCYRHNLDRPKSQLTHPLGSQQMRCKLLEPVGHPWGDLGLQSCHRQNLECPKSQPTPPPGSQKMRGKLLEPAGHPWVDLGL